MKSAALLWLAATVSTFEDRLQAYEVRSPLQMLLLLLEANVLQELQCLALANQ